MRKNNFIYLIFILILTSSCSKEKLIDSSINEKSLDLQVLEVYQEGKDYLEAGDVLFAAKKFNEAETLFPQSNWAPRAALMAAYSYYSKDYYGDAIAELERFLRVYPKHPNQDYVHYLLAICYYEQIIDEKKDLQTIIKSKEYFEIVLNNYPNTEYAVDSDFKIGLINDILASKEMYIGRYYFNKKKWIPAINRFKVVVEDFETTIFVEEALHRLVEIHYTIGLKDEAKKYANLLGYNYRSSKWYERSYGVFNEMYAKKRIKDEKNNKSILRKAKSLFE